MHIIFIFDSHHLHFEGEGIGGRRGYSHLLQVQSLPLSLPGHSPLHMQNMSCCPLTPAQFAAVTHFFFISV